MNGRLTRILSSAITFKFLVFTAILVRCGSEVLYLQMDSDYGAQYEAAGNFLNGHGLANASVDPASLCEIHYEKLSKWPVMFPLALACIQFLTGNWFMTAWIIQSLSFILLLFSCLKLFRFLGLSLLAKSMFLVFFILSASIPYYFGTTDVLTTALFVWMAYFSLRYLSSEGSGMRWLILIGVLGALNATLRFACIPYILVFPAFLLLIAWMKMSKRIFFGSVLVICLSSGLAFLFYTLNPIDSTRTSFTENLFSFNFYWSNFKWFDAFVVKALFYTVPIEYRLPASISFAIPVYRIALYLLSLVLFILIFSKYLNWKALKNIVVKHSSETQPAEWQLFLLFVITAVFVVGFISLQSLTTPPEKNSFGPAWMPPFWTFVYSHRYFAFLVILVQVFFFVRLNDQNERFRRSLLFIYGGSVIYSLIFFAWTCSQILLPGGNGGATFWANEKERLELYEHITLVEDSKNIVYASFDLGQKAPIMLFAGAVPCRSYELLLQDSIPACPNTILVLQSPLEHLQSTVEKNFVERNGLQKVLTFKGSVIYQKNF